MAQNNDETLSKYVAQINTFYVELLRMQNRQENSPEARPSQEGTAPNPKREVSVASAARSMSPGTTQVILTAIERMDQRISGLSEKVNRSDEKASGSRPSEEPARGRSVTWREPGQPDDGDDGSDDSEHSSDSDFLEGEPPWEGDDPTGEEDRGPVRININPLSQEVIAAGEPLTKLVVSRNTTRSRFLSFPLPNLSAWKLQVGKNLVAAGGRIDQREIAWWAEVNKDTSNFDSLEDPGEDRFVSLDLKLSISLSVMLKEVNNEVITSTAQREHAAARQSKMLKGRQIAWLIFTFFKRNPKMGVFYSVTDLAKLKWMGDKQIHRFLMTWRLVLDQTQTTLPAEELIEILMQRVALLSSRRTLVTSTGWTRTTRTGTVISWSGLWRIIWTARGVEPTGPMIFSPCCPRPNRGQVLHLSSTHLGEIPPRKRANVGRRRGRKGRQLELRLPKRLLLLLPLPKAKEKGRDQEKKRRRVTTSISLAVAPKPPRNVGSSIRSSPPLKLLKWCSPYPGPHQEPTLRLVGGQYPKQRLAPKRKALVEKGTPAIALSLRSRAVATIPAARSCILMKQ